MELFDVNLFRIFFTKVTFVIFTKKKRLFRIFLWPRGGTGDPWVNSSRTYPEACHALTGAVFHLLSKMRAHVAADARVTSEALYL